MIKYSFEVMESLVVNLLDARISHKEIVLLNNVNFAIAPAEFAYLIGKTGAGKSSLLKVLYGEFKLISGHGEVLGIDLKSLSQRNIFQLRRKIGIVFQDLSLFDSWTVFDNLDFVLKATDWVNLNEREERIKKVLEEVNLLDKISSYVHELSGGEQQRLSIARAILNTPKLIIADEPTGSLDPESADEILYLLHRIAKQNHTAVILATHDYRIIKKFPARVYECKKESITEIQ